MIYNVIEDREHKCTKWRAASIDFMFTTQCGHLKLESTFIVLTKAAIVRVPSLFRKTVKHSVLCLGQSLVSAHRLFLLQSNPLLQWSFVDAETGVVNRQQFQTFVTKLQTHCPSDLNFQGMKLLQMAPAL